MECIIESLKKHQIQRTFFHSNNYTRLCCVAAYSLTYSQSALPCYIMEWNRTAPQLQCLIHTNGVSLDRAQQALHAGTPITGLGPGIAVCKLTPMCTISSSFPAAGSEHQQHQHVGLVKLQLVIVSVRFSSEDVHSCIAATILYINLLDLHLFGSFTGGDYWYKSRDTVKPPNKGHIGDNINSTAMSFVQRGCPLLGVSKPALVFLQ